MWGETSNDCEVNCQCSGLITDNFRINSGNNSKKRKQEEAVTANYRHKMNPHHLDFGRQSPHNSPITTPSKRRILGEIHNSLFRQDMERIKSPMHHQMDRIKSPLTQKSPNQAKSPLHSQVERLKSPLINQKSPLRNLSNSPFDRISPLIDRTSSSPLTSRSLNRSTKITRIFEDRTRFKMSNKENSPFMSETFMKLADEEETRDCPFGDTFQGQKNWSTTKLDFTDALPPSSLSRSYEAVEDIGKDTFVPQKILHDKMEPDLETLHDLEEEFDADNFDQCNKYEIISTDSPNIISRGRSSSRKVTSSSFVFGAPLSDTEQSTSFNKPNTTNRTLNFEDDAFEFTSPATKRPSTSSVSVKKSLKFTESPLKTVLKHERSDSSIGSMSSPGSSKMRFPSESTTSMESGFISELEEPFLDMEELSNSPKLANFNELLSGQIKDNFLPEKEFSLKRPGFHRSLSFNPEASRARVSLFPITESPCEKKTNKRTVAEDCGSSKRKKSNCHSPEFKSKGRPILQRAFSENNASIMSALARAAGEPDLIGDFSLPFALPLTAGDHTDLKSIACDTLAAVLRGQYRHAVREYRVIDCRYPYEYEGGHILGAVNLYTPEQIQGLVSAPLPPREEGQRSILVFHCEFSLERGPKLFRYLRSSDRAKNMESYPNLHYPEVYLLHEGYRAFYERYPELCSPAGYTAMLDPQHRHLLRKHRSMSSSSSSHRQNRLLL